MSPFRSKQASGRLYNVGVGGNTSIRSLHSHLEEILGCRLPPNQDKPRAGDVRHSQADISRARRELGYEPAISLAEGLRRTVEAHRDPKSGINNTHGETLALRIHARAS